MNLLDAIFGKPDPKRFAQEVPPVGWVEPPKPKARRSGTTAYLLDDATNTYGFTDKPFEVSADAPQSSLTDRDRAELIARNLDPHNPGYAAAKDIFSRNPQVSKKELYEQIPAIAKETFKDVLAAFRAANRN